MYMQFLTLLFSARTIGLSKRIHFLMVCCILLHQFKPKFRKLSDESLQIKTKHLEIGVTITKLTNHNNMDIFIYFFLFCMFLVGVLSCVFKD